MYFERRRSRSTRATGLARAKASAPAPKGDGGGSGSIVGRNSFQRPKDDALKLLDQIVKIYKNEA